LKPWPEIGNYLKKLATQYSGVPTKKYECIVYRIAARNPKYNHFGVITGLALYLQEKHPIVRNVRVCLVEATNQAGMKALEKIGWSFPIKLGMKT